MKLDSHQHFWKYSAAEYPWIDEAKRKIARDFLPGDLEPILARHGLDGSIAVQARQSLEESRWLLSLAGEHSSIKGVVGWVDLRSENVTQQLSELAKHPKFVGVRHVLQDEPDDEFMLQPQFVRGLRELRQFNLKYDLLIYPRQLAAAIELTRLLPDQTFVLDHIAKPEIKYQKKSPWNEQIRELAQNPKIFCKVSGMVTEADWQAWKPSDFFPYLEIVSECFGEDRLMFGSDWPVCLLAADYEQVFGLIGGFFGKSAVSKIVGENAAKVYGVRVE